MAKFLAILLLLAGLGSIAFAGPRTRPGRDAFDTPEINAGMAGSALTFLTGAVLVIRGRRRK